MNNVHLASFGKKFIQIAFWSDSVMTIGSTLAKFDV